MYVCMCASVHVYVCMYVCIRMYVCMCLCGVCVCVVRSVVCIGARASVCIKNRFFFGL